MITKEQVKKAIIKTLKIDWTDMPKQCIKYNVDKILNEVLK